jgi:hypothetical protein
MQIKFDGAVTSLLEVGGSESALAAETDAALWLLRIWDSSVLQYAHSYEC